MLEDSNPWASEPRRNVMDDDPWRQPLNAKVTSSQSPDDGWGAFEGSQSEPAFERSEGASQKLESVSTHKSSLDPWGGLVTFDVDLKDRVESKPVSKVHEVEDGSAMQVFPRPRPIEIKRSTPSPRPPRSHRASPRPPKDENVLFDAENLSSEDEGDGEEVVSDEVATEDDWGDFENAKVKTESSPAAIQSTALDQPRESKQSNLIDFDEFIKPPSAQTTSIPYIRQSSTKPAMQDRDPFGNLDAVFNRFDLQDQSPKLQGNLTSGESARMAHSTSTRHHAFAQKQPDHGDSTTSNVEDLLGDADISTAQIKPIPQNRPLTTNYNTGNGLTSISEGTQKVDPENNFDATVNTTDNWNAWEDFETSNSTVEPSDAVSYNSMPFKLPKLLRPGSKVSSLIQTNIPPPALLLSLFPPIFDLTKTELLDHLHEQPNTQSILEHEVTRNFLIDYLNIVTVLGRIIAGRKLRWKRDTLLSQSMSIGPASSGGARGMKLTSLDKSESAREEREVSNALRHWRLQLGKLRAAVAGSGIKSKIPEIADMLPVRIAQPSEGAINAMKACLLCALKRNERVPKVDYDVQDSFGEWWTEYWGHSACKDVWQTYEKDLRSR